jgi:hypothetical protein
MLIEFQLVSGKRIISSIFSFFFLVFLTTWQHAKVRPSSDYSTHPPADGGTTATGAPVRGTDNGSRRWKASPKPEADQEDVQSDTLTTQLK